MAIINWDDSFSVNVDEIDKQHHKLVDMINDLNDAMKQGQDKDILGKTISDLIDYTGTHFGTEEKYFDEFGYSETESHKKEHSDFVGKVSEFKSKFDAGTSELSAEIMDFLANWLQGHIKGIDKKYVPFFNENGLT
jgi:hemerythrin